VIPVINSCDSQANITGLQQLSFRDTEPQNISTHSSILTLLETQAGFHLRQACDEVQQQLQLINSLPTAQLQHIANQLTAFVDDAHLG